MKRLSTVVSTLVFLLAVALFSVPAFAAEPAAGTAGQESFTIGQSGALTAQAGEETQPNEVSMHRLYNKYSGEHFYTASTDERDHLVSVGWNYEGVGWTAPKTSEAPVYRLYNAYGGEHHYTMSASERDNLVNVGWRYEGIGWYSAGSGSFRIALYREYNPNAYSCNHNYTTSMSEHSMLVKVGWQSEGTAWYGLASKETFTNGWVLDGSTWRYYSNGSALKGSWVVTDSPPGIGGSITGMQRYWIDVNGSLAAGRLIDGNTARDAGAGYLAYARDGGYVVRGKYDNQAGRVYVADNDGRLPTETGWLVTSRYDGGLQRYYIDAATHAARSGLFTVDGKQYFGLANQGYVARNTRVEANGTWYAADNDGVLTVDSVVSRLVFLAQSYSSPSEYLIMVDIDDPCTVVFEGYQGNWNVKYVWDCCTGAPETPTVEGVFSVGIKGYSFGEGHGYSCYYYTQFYGDYLFHTRKYYANTHTLLDGRMGERVSEGCVRLYDEDAIWIWNNVPAGTTVVTTY